MITQNYDTLVQQIADAGDLDAYLKMVGLYALTHYGRFSQTAIRHAAEAALDVTPRTGRRYARRIEILHELSGHILSAPPPRSP